MKMYYTTTSDLNNAERISKIFLNDKKAVCINLIKNVNSFYLDDNSINFANEIGAEKTFFTHISHRLGFHEKVNKELPDGMFLAYDNLILSI